MEHQETNNPSIFYPSVQAIADGDHKYDRCSSDPQNKETASPAIAIKIPSDDDRTTKGDQITQIGGEFVEDQRQYSSRC